MPKTILEISGFSKSDINWQQSALVLIDFQNEYVAGELALNLAAREAIGNANKLLTHARALSAPVFHVVHHGTSIGKLFNPTGAGAEIIPDITVLEGEPVVVKGLPDAFANTNLQQLIDQNQRDNLIVAGFMSHMCVSSTVRSSLEKGYTNFVCEDACYTRDLRGTDGQTILSKTVHQVSMAALQDRFATVCRTAEIISGDVNSE